MKKVGIIFVFITLAISTMAQVGFQDWQRRQRRVPSISFGLDVGEPRGQFAQNFDGVPVGIGGQFLSNIRRSPIEAGFGFSWMSRGSMNEDVWIYQGVDVDGDDVFSQGEVSVNSNIYTYNGVLRLKPFAGAIQPYGDLIVGIRNFSTVSIIRPDEDDGPETRDRQHRDFTYTYGWAAGLKVRLTPVMYVEGRFSNLYGGAVDFIDRETIEVGDEGIIGYDFLSSRTDMFIYQLGISFQF